MTDVVCLKALFDIKDLYFKSLFDTAVYAWDVLSNIKKYISEFPKNDLIQYADGVFCGENVRIHPSAVINGPALIGSNTEIRPFAYIRGNVIIGNACVIGNSTELKNSVLMNGVQVPHYNYVGDSVLGNFSHLGAGTICSNLKSDSTNVVVHSCEDVQTNRRKLGAIIGDGVEIGCNCVLNPGTVVGRNSTVYPMNSVRGCVPPDSIFKGVGNIIAKT